MNDHKFDPCSFIYVEISFENVLPSKIFKRILLIERKSLSRGLSTAQIAVRVTFLPLNVKRSKASRRVEQEAE